MAHTGDDQGASRPDKPPNVKPKTMCQHDQKLIWGWTLQFCLYIAILLAVRAIIVLLKCLRAHPEKHEACFEILEQCLRGGVENDLHTWLACSKLISSHAGPDWLLSNR